MWKKSSFLFLLSLVVGLVIGLVIAWGLFPAKPGNGPLSDLRTDLKIDYVKLVAGSYTYHNDINTAIERLNRLGNPSEILELTLAHSTDTEKDQILQLQSHLPPIVEATAGVAMEPATSAIVIPPARNLYIGYGFLAVCILALTLASVRGGRQDWPGFHFLWKSYDMRKRIITVIVLVIIYRLAAKIPLTGINQEAARKAMEMTDKVHGGIGGFILSMDVLSGGTLSTFSILSIGIYGYVIASVVVNLIPVMSPSLKQRLLDDSRAGQQWIARWTSWGSLVLSIPLSWLLLNLYSGKFAACMGLLINAPTIQVGTSNLLSSITIILEIVAAAKFAEWLADVISDSFRAMGSSIIIALGIVPGIMQAFNKVLTNQNPREIVIFELLVIALILLAIYTMQGRRNVPIMYPHISHGPSAMGSGKAIRLPRPSLPLMVGMAGIAPVLATQCLLTLPVFVTVPLLCTGQVKWQAFAESTGAFLNASNPTYWLIFAVLLIIFTFFYNDVLLANQNYGQNLRRSRAQIPGLHLGQTDRYLQRIMRVITIPYSLLLVAITLLPYLVIRTFHLDISPMLGISIFLLVGITRDALMNLQAELILQGYHENLLIR